MKLTPLRERVRDDLVGLALVGSIAEHHRAETDDRDVETAPAEPPVFHQDTLQNSRDAIRAPSAIAAIFAHTTSGSTAACPTHVP